jgi:hypothetical protein
LLLAKAIKTTINLIIGWVFLFSCSLYITLDAWFCGLVWQSTYRIFYFTLLFSTFMDRSYHFFTQSLLNPSFKFSKKEALHLTPGLLYLLYIIAIWLWPIHFLITISIKTEWTRLWAMVSKTRLLSMIVYFILSIRYYNVYKTHVSSSELCRFGFV